MDIIVLGRVKSFHDVLCISSFSCSTGEVELSSLRDELKGHMFGHGIVMPEQSSIVDDADSDSCEFLQCGVVLGGES